MTTDGKAVADAGASNAVVGVWSSTDRKRLQVTGVASSRKAKSHKANEPDDVQVSRLGNPLVNEVVIPLGKKDLFNATQPSDDLKNFGKYVLSPELAKVINILYPGLNVPETDRTDIVQALLTGLPGLTEIAKNAPPTDTLKINLGVPPTAPDKSRRSASWPATTPASPTAAGCRTTWSTSRCEWSADS